MPSHIRITQSLIRVGVQRKVSRVFKVTPFGIPSGIVNSVFTDEGQILRSLGASNPGVLGKPTSTNLVLTSDLAVSGLMKWASQSGINNPTLTNKSGSDRAAYDVIVWDGANDSAFKTTTVEADTNVAGVTLAAIANNAAGLCGVAPQLVTVNVAGNVTRGNYLITSTTAGRAKDGGASAGRSGSFAIALTGYAGGGNGQVTAILLKGAGGGKGYVQFLVAAVPNTSGAPITGLDGASSPVEGIPYFEFVNGSVTYRDYYCRLINYQGGGLTVRFEVMRTSAGAAATYIFEAAIRRVNTGSEDLAAVHTYDYNQVTVTIPAGPPTATIPMSGTITFTDGPDMDSLASGETFILRFRRNGGTATDTARVLPTITAEET